MNPPTTETNPRPAPSLWAVVLGYHHADDSIECLQSLARSDAAGLRLLYVDNGSDEAEFRRALEGAPPATRVLRFAKNVGVGRGFNAGMRDALEQGAELVLIINNDTKVDPHALARLADAAARNPKAGLLVPKIFYYDHPETIWSAGARYRRFPPSVVLQRTRGSDDGCYDAGVELEFTSFCATLFRRDFLEQVGLLDADYRVFQEDYDLCIRARAAGWCVRLAPEAHIWHKVSKSTHAGSRNPDSWRAYGRSEALFARKHGRAWPWLTGPAHRLYVLTRIVAEGKSFGLRPFLEGYREGRHLPLTRPPRPADPPAERPEVVRT